MNKKIKSVFVILYTNNNFKRELELDLLLAKTLIHNFLLKIIKKKIEEIVDIFQVSEKGKTVDLNIL